MAKRDDREYLEYSREKQRGQPGCPAREVVLAQRGQATSKDRCQGSRAGSSRRGTGRPPVIGQLDGFTPAATEAWPAASGIRESSAKPLPDH